MVKKTILFFKEYWKKFVLIGALALACGLFERLSFPKIEVFVRDALQFLNSTEKINKSLVTLNIDILNCEYQRPYKLDSIKAIITKLQKAEPKFVLLLMEPLDFTNDPIERKLIFDFISTQKNLYLNAFEARNESASFIRDPLFQKSPNFFKFIITSDQLTGAQDNKNRRAMISLKNHGPAEIINSLKTLDLDPKDENFFKYNWKYWDTTQVYLKNFPLGTFGNYQSSDLLSDKIRKDVFKNKTVLVGTHDEFSYLAHPSVFDFFGKIEGNNVRQSLMPFQEIVAHLINFYTTGDYVKLIGVNDIIIIFFILSLLVLVEISFKKKLIAFISLLPLLLAFEILIYITGSYYIDFSRTIALLILLQYLGIPLVMLLHYRILEKEKFKEINNTRIDSLLLVAERVAHDIRSPLSAINIILSRVSIDNLEHRDILYNSLKRIDESAEKILTKYKSIKGTSKSEELEEINISDLLISISEEKKILNPIIKFNFDLEKAIPMYALGYKLELEQIISNILDNSLAAVQPKGPDAVIYIKCYRNQGQLIIKIIDNGIGIPSNVLVLLGRDKITTRSNENGNGIAILHAKRIIETMSGKFEIDSIESQHTTVSISLKMASSDTN